MSFEAISEKMGRVVVGSELNMCSCNRVKLLRRTFESVLVNLCVIHRSVLGERNYDKSQLFN